MAAWRPTGLLIDGRELRTEARTPVLDKYTGAVIDDVSVAGPAEVEAAVAAADRAFCAGAPPPYERFEILSRAACIIGERASAFVDTIVAETGFTTADAEREVARCRQTLTLAGEEAKRIAGEMVPMAGAPGQHDRLAFTLRFPLGVVAAITPFNSPLNTVTHKVAPALAAGNAVVLKPAGATPLTAAMLCRALLDAGLPPGLLALLHGPGGAVGRLLVTQPAVRYITFTGSTAVGLAIQAAAGLRRTQMELGSIASTIVCGDANLDVAIPKIVDASFRKAGQVCTSIQRLHVARPRLDEVRERLAAAIGRVKVGDPRAPGTLTGPMISEQEAARAQVWCEEALSAGAKCAAGGGREGAVLRPTLLEMVPSESRVLTHEIFAPVVSLVAFDSVAEAIDDVNATPFGLAAGIFTAALDDALHAARRLRIGGIHVNETASSRVDLMPYGGVKDSGFGQEGPKYAIREMMEERLVTISMSGAA